MKCLSTILAATLVAGSCTLALAQAGGAGGADQTQQGNMKDADKNPTGPAANPSAGNTAGGSAARSGMTTAPRGEMTTAPASNTRSDDPARPANTKDNTGAATGSGGSK